MTSLSSPKLEARRQVGRRIKEPETRIKATVSKSGTGAHVFVPKDWIGKTVEVVVLDDETPVKKVQK